MMQSVKENVIRNCNMEWLELNQVDARERYESLLENDFRDLIYYQHLHLNQKKS